jgi:hypothetical protein
MFNIIGIQSMENTTKHIRNMLTILNENIAENQYSGDGFNSREEYLELLADEYDLPLKTVLRVAEMLGPEEDFDQLPVELHSISELGKYSI